MVALMDKRGHVFAEGKNIDEIMEELNKDNGDWEYWYRRSNGDENWYRRPYGVVDAYFSKDGESDVLGEEADEIYEVIENY